MRQKCQACKKEISSIERTEAEVSLINFLMMTKYIFKKSCEDSNSLQLEKEVINYMYNKLKNMKNIKISSLYTRIISSSF